MSKRSLIPAFGVLVSLLMSVASACTSSSADDGGTGGAATSGGTGGTATSGGTSSTGNGGASNGSGGISMGGAATLFGGRAGLGGASQGGKPPATSGGAASGGTKPTAQGGLTAAGGSTGKPCEAIQCFRAIECVEECWGPVISSGCCPCENGTFDRVTECRGEGGAGGASGLDLSKLNSPCESGACPSGLTPTKFYGIAGKSGPEFCWCTIPCASPKVVCPSGTTCQTIADGPGQVCTVTR